jgi:phosphoglycolate phosphatase
MSIKGIVFDKDGTLTDFHRTWIPAYRHAASHIAEQVGREALSTELLVIGGFDEATGRCQPSSPLACGSTAEIARLWSTHSGCDYPGVLERLEATFERHAASRPVPAADLVGLFTRLRERGLLLGVATMDSEALAHATLARLEVARFVSFVCGYDSGYGVKPAPGMVLAFCRALGLAPSEVAVVGDTPHDIGMGRAARAGLVIGVLTGASLGDALVKDADHVLSSIGGLESVL